MPFDVLTNNTQSFRPRHDEAIPRTDTLAWQASTHQWTWYARHIRPSCSWAGGGLFDDR